MNFYKITRKAKLSENIIKIYENQMNQLENLQNYLKLLNKLDIGKIELEISYKSILINLITCSDAFLKDILEEIVYSNPDEIQSEKVSLQTIINSNNISNTVRSAAEVYCYKYFYGNIYQIVEDLNKRHSFDKISENKIKPIAEIHATRNILVHNNGVVNDKYLGLAKENARADKGEHLIIDYSYVNNALIIIKEFMNEIFKAMPKEYKNLSKTIVFKLYWENTLLEHSLKFSDAWELHEDYIYPKQKLIDRYTTDAFSHSEYYIVSFFMYIFDPFVYVKAKIDLRQIYSHFKEESNEIKMISAWINAPFFF